MAERIRQIFENPDVLKDLFTDTALSNIIDPTKVGVRMDVTPPTPWRPVTPKAPK